MAAILPADSPTSDAEETARLFLQVLVSVIRAEDAYGACDAKTDADLLGPFVLTRDARRALPMFGDPDSNAIRRVDQFFRAVAIATERKTGLMASSMTSLHSEGFGRVVIIIGKLVAYTKTLRDVHRFGFDNISALSVAGARAISQAQADVDSYPDAARA